jgi:putative chitinase
MSLPVPFRYILPIESAQKIFPFTPASNIQIHLPDVLKAAEEASSGRTLLIIALATIRAETESFIPAAEQRSRFNTSPTGKPFDLYDSRRELGNQGPPDGALYRGRGYVQLTGRYNYGHFGAKLGVDLLGNPDLAAQPYTAAQILFTFLTTKREKLNECVSCGNLAGARRLVNGGSHGLERFCDAYRRADSVIPRT